MCKKILSRGILPSLNTEILNRMYEVHDIFLLLICNIDGGMVIITLYVLPSCYIGDYRGSVFIPANYSFV